jgi:hypothetical protein
VFCLFYSPEWVHCSWRCCNTRSMHGMDTHIPSFYSSVSLGKPSSWAQAIEYPFRIRGQRPIQNALKIILWMWQMSLLEFFNYILRVYSHAHLAMDVR